MNRKGEERRKMNNYVIDSRNACTGQKTRNVVHIEFFFFFFLIDRVMVNC